MRARTVGKIDAMNSELKLHILDYLPHIFLLVGKIDAMNSELKPFHTTRMPHR